MGNYHVFMCVLCVLGIITCAMAQNVPGALWAFTALVWVFSDGRHSR